MPDELELEEELLLEDELEPPLEELELDELLLEELELLEGCGLLVGCSSK